MTPTLARFLKYVTFDTQSDYNSETFPSTATQLEFARILASECETIGIQQVYVSPYGYVYCHIPGNTKAPAVGFIAHMDTSGDCSGFGVHPRVIPSYDGKDIFLNAHTTLSPKRFPDLLHYLNQEIVVTDGTTLLGADDKAGIAAIMSAAEHIVATPSIPHGDIYVAFTPDEEVGRGMDHFETDRFQADFAYTIDGGRLGELEYESFNAARALIHIKGESVHPGYAKGIMKNAMLIGNELINKLPSKESPQETEGYEGYFHLNSFQGSVEKADLSILIRDFDKTAFERRKHLLRSWVDELNHRYANCITLELKDEYYNMAEIIGNKMDLIHIAKAAMEKLEITPIIRPIRGGTDGSRLSFMGIPCPNIFAGGHNFHGPYEFLPVPSLEKAVLVIEEIITSIAAQN